MQQQRYSNVIWHGDFKTGRGYLTTESGVIRNEEIGFKKRFDTEKGTNPEELLAAAHASCFSMAFANELGLKDLVIDKIDVNCRVTLIQDANGIKITESYLDVNVVDPGGKRKIIEEAAKIAKENCPVSQVFKCNIKMDLNISESFENAFSQ